jgi:hypothetical protein
VWDPIAEQAEAASRAPDPVVLQCSARGEHERDDWTHLELDCGHRGRDVQQRQLVERVAALAQSNQRVPREGEYAHCDDDGRQRIAPTIALPLES